eukprot:6609674-Pyramimonas_sp.AAC.2
MPPPPPRRRPPSTPAHSTPPAWRPPPPPPGTQPPQIQRMSIQLATDPTDANPDRTDVNPTGHGLSQLVPLQSPRDARIRWDLGSPSLRPSPAKVGWPQARPAARDAHPKRTTRIPAGPPPRTRTA